MIQDKDIPTEPHQSISIEPADESDLAAILNLLDESGLPQAGLTDHLSATVVARADRQLVGSATLELYGPAALLRSVAVAPTYRGRGLGQELTLAALTLAQARGVTYVYLLTETAPQFFPKFGFRLVERAQVPPAVQRSLEFSSLCPAQRPGDGASLRRHNRLMIGSGRLG